MVWCYEIPPVCVIFVICFFAGYSCPIVVTMPRQSFHQSSIYGKGGRKSCGAWNWDQTDMIFVHSPSFQVTVAEPLVALMSALSTSSEASNQNGNKYITYSFEQKVGGCGVLQEFFCYYLKIWQRKMFRCLLRITILGACKFITVHNWSWHWFSERPGLVSPQ